MIDDSMTQRVRAVAQAFSGAELLRLKLTSADFELELRRSLPYLVAPAVPLAVPAALTLAAEGEPAAALPAPSDQKADIISSDLVGVVRFSRPQVAEGNQLEGDRELAFVEALGIRNPVRSRGTGRISAVLVTDGQPVEYGQPLFAIER